MSWLEDKANYNNTAEQIHISFISLPEDDTHTPGTVGISPDLMSPTSLTGWSPAVSSIIGDFSSPLGSFETSQE